MQNLKLERDDEFGLDFKNTKTDEIIACRMYGHHKKWACAKGKDWHDGLKIIRDFKSKEEALKHILRFGDLK